MVNRHYVISLQGASSSATTVHNIFRASTDTDSMEINMVNRHYVTASTSHEPHRSFRALFGRPAGHGPVHTNEKHAIIIPQAKAGDNTYSLLQLSGVGGGGIRGENFQTFRNEAVKLLSNIQSKAEKCGGQPQQPQQQCSFNICATDILTDTAASSSFKGVQIHRYRQICLQARSSKLLSRAKWPAKYSSIIQMAADFLPSR